MLAAIFGVMAFITAWMALFDQPYIKEEDRPLRAILAPGVVLFAVAGTAVLLMPRWTSILWDFLPVVTRVSLSGVVYGGAQFLVRHRKSSLLRLLIGVCSFLVLAAPVTLRFGFLAASDLLSLGGVHFLSIILCIALTIVLWLRRCARAYHAVRASAITSLVFLACLAIMFISSFPRAGDEVLMLWLFITPGILLASAALFLTCVAILATFRMRRPAGRRHGRPSRENLLR